MSFKREVEIVLEALQGERPHLILMKESRDFSRVAVGSLGYSRVAKGSSANLSCCEGEHGIALESLQGIGPHLTGRVETRGVSRVAAGSFGFILSSNENLREPLMFPQGRQASFQVARATQDSSGVAAG